MKGRFCGRYLSRGFTRRRYSTITGVMHAYLGITNDGSYRLCVSTVELNQVGTRLERGKHRRLPENVRLWAQDTQDPQAAIAGLISLRNFLNGQEYGAPELAFGEDELPLLRRKKK